MRIQLHNIGRIGAGLALFLAIAGCSVAPEGVSIHDPYEAANRRTHAFNKGLDTALVRPMSNGVALLPEEATDTVLNFASNLSLPGMVLNGLLQADLEGVATNTARFLLNSTFGIGGLFDPASRVGLYAETTDFGETLAVWGVPEGAYVELPFYGSSTERDAIGLLVDFVIDPLRSYHGGEYANLATSAYLADKVVTRGRFGDTVDSLLYESADSYAQLRLYYLQNRRFELGQDAADTYMDPYAMSGPDDFVDPYALPAADLSYGDFVDPYEDF